MKKILVFSFAVLAILFISGCKKDAPCDPVDPKANLEKLYQASVEDAITADSSEICDTLWAINSSNTKPEWSTINNEPYVLAENFNHYPESYSDTSLINSWVVIMSQLLGLPPSNTHTYIVELRVKPGDLYRPAGDPEIDYNNAN